MTESVYKVIEVVGTSPVSWEKAAAAAVKAASKSLRNLRIAEVTKLDMHLDEGNVLSYRARLSLSFKYDLGDAKAAPKSSPVEPKAAPVAKKVARRKK